MKLLPERIDAETCIAVRRRRLFTIEGQTEQEERKDSKQAHDAIPFRRQTAAAGMAAGLTSPDHLAGTVKKSAGL